MNSVNKTTNTSLALGCTVLMVCLLTMYWVVQWTDYNLEYWLTMVKGHDVIVPNWISWIFCFVFWPIAIAFDIISYLLQLVI